MPTNSINNNTAITVSTETSALARNPCVGDLQALTHQFRADIADFCLEPKNLPSPYSLSARPAFNFAELVALNWIAETVEGQRFVEIMRERYPEFTALEKQLFEENLLCEVRERYTDDNSNIRLELPAATRIFNQNKKIFLTDFQPIDSYITSDDCIDHLTTLDEHLQQYKEHLQQGNKTETSQQLLERIDEVIKRLESASTLRDLLVIVTMLTELNEFLAKEPIVDPLVADQSENPKYSEQQELIDALELLFELPYEAAMQAASKIPALDAAQIPGLFQLSQSNEDIKLIGVLLKANPELLDGNPQQNCSRVVTERVKPLLTIGFNKSEAAALIDEAPKLLTAPVRKFETLIEHLAQLKMRLDRFAPELNDFSAANMPKPWVHRSEQQALSGRLNKIEKADYAGMGNADARIVELVQPKVQSLYFAEKSGQPGAPLCKYPVYTAAILLAMRELEYDRHGARIEVDRKERGSVYEKVGKYLPSRMANKEMFSQAILELSDYGVMASDTANLEMLPNNSEAWPEPLKKLDQVAQLAKRPRGGHKKSRF